MIGEGQILSQVKQAYALARDAEATSTILNLLFHRAIATGKRVRTETRIAFSSGIGELCGCGTGAQHVWGLSHSNVLISGQERWWSLQPATW